MREELSQALAEARQKLGAVDDFIDVEHQGAADYYKARGDVAMEAVNALRWLINVVDAGGAS